MMDLTKKKELILARELAFANSVGAAVIDKPKVNFWMVLVPLLFLYFIQRMHKYKNGRIKFDEEFMVTRRRAMDLAIEAYEPDRRLDVDQAVHQYGLPEELEKPYTAWITALVDHYRDLLAVEGDSYDALVRKAYRNRTSYLLTLNRLSAVEKEFYAAIKPSLASAEGATDVINAIENESRRLRRDLAERVFS